MILPLAANVASVAIEVAMAFGAFVVGVGAAALYFRLAAPKAPADARGAEPANQFDPQANDAERANMAAQQLRDLAHNVASDVGVHNALVGDISNELGSIINVGDNGNGALVMSSIAKILTANGKLLCRLEDAERKIQAQAEEIRSQQSEARTDSLTHLANRRAFDSCMQESLGKFRTQRRPFSVLMLDVDHFKQFNDTHGHQAGDEVLRRVGATLSRTVKAGDIPCRYGGEEFALVLNNTKSSEAQIACERVRKAIEGMTVQFEGKTLRVTASIGVAEIIAGEEGAQLVRRADDAVYASKKAGRNCWHWHNGDESLSAAASKGAPAKPKVEEPAPLPCPVLLSESARDGLRFPDRAAFGDELGRRIAESHRTAGPLSIVMFRIAEFEKLQTTYGSQVGALLTDSLATFIRSTLRDMDLLGKFDRGELALMLPGSTESAARIVGQRIKTSISQCPIALGPQEIRLDLDMGVAAAAADDTSTSLMAAARESLERPTGAEAADLELVEA